MAMAGADGRHDGGLTALLAREPYRFDIRQAVRLLELMAPGRVPIGAGSDPQREAVRLRSSLTSSFPPSDIESLTDVGSGERPTLTVTFLGIGGAFGPLPPPLTARVVDRARSHDDAGRDFLDLFNHRLLSLMLRQARLFHPALQGEGAPGPDMPARLPLLALLGLATLPHDGSSASAEARLGHGAASLVETAGLLNPRPVSAHALERLLAAHFGFRVRVLPLRGGWLTLAEDQRLRLGRGALPLGHHAVLGGRIWDQAAGIRVAVGPTGLDMLLSLLPGGAAHAELARLVAFTLGRPLDVELLLLLRPSEVPPSALGPPSAERGDGPRLGWTSWLGRQPRRAPGTVQLRLGTGLTEHS